MTLWMVRDEGKALRMGGRKVVKLTRKGCNQPYLGRFWCPRRSWFQMEPCPFSSAQECAGFKRMCGEL